MWHVASFERDFNNFVDITFEQNNSVRYTTSLRIIMIIDQNLAQSIIYIMKESCMRMIINGVNSFEFIASENGALQFFSPFFSNKMLECIAVPVSETVQIYIAPQKLM